MWNTLMWGPVLIYVGLSLKLFFLRMTCNISWIPILKVWFMCRLGRCLKQAAWHQSKRKLFMKHLRSWIYQSFGNGMMVMSATSSVCLLSFWFPFWFSGAERFTCMKMLSMLAGCIAKQVNNFLVKTHIGESCQKDVCMLWDTSR